MRRANSYGLRAPRLRRCASRHVRRYGELRSAGMPGLGRPAALVAGQRRRVDRERRQLELERPDGPAARVAGRRAARARASGSSSVERVALLAARAARRGGELERVRPRRVEAHAVGVARRRAPGRPRQVPGENVGIARRAPGVDRRASCRRPRTRRRAGRARSRAPRRSTAGARPQFSSRSASAPGRTGRGRCARPSARRRSPRGSRASSTAAATSGCAASRAPPGAS